MNQSLNLSLKLGIPEDSDDRRSDGRRSDGRHHDQKRSRTQMKGSVTTTA